MGYNITFHPITREELQYYIFDVLTDFSLAESRVLKLTQDEVKRDRLRALYREWPEMIHEVRKGNASFASNIAYPSCVIAGFLHPYWFAEDGCITFLGEEERNVKVNPLLKIFGKKGPSDFKTLLITLRAYSPEVFEGIQDESYGMIFGNYTASGFIAPDKVRDLKIALTAKHTAYLVDKILNDKAKRALMYAIDYAIAHDCGLMEASEIFIDNKNLSFSDSDHLKR